MSDYDDDEQPQDLYDEFGNYVGPDLNDDDTSSDDDDDDDSSLGGDVVEEINEDIGHSQRDGDDGISDVDEETRKRMAMIVSEGNNTLDIHDETTTSASTISNTAIVLHEDKEHYMSAEQVYGNDVTVAVLDEDAMDLDQPIVEPVLIKTHQVTYDSSAGEKLSYGNIINGENDWLYSNEYLNVHLMNETTRTRRSFTIIGQYHHGKTTFIDLLIESTLKHKEGLYWGPRASLNVNYGGGPRYLDIYHSEQLRQMSLVSTPITTLLNDSRQKSYCCTMIDNPGHINFYDENVTSMKLVDGVVIMIDCVEGIMLHTEQSLRHALIIEGLPIVVVISKIDRLIVELKLPPRDAYYKLLHIIESINVLIQEITNNKYPIKISPEYNNVAFTSAQHGYIFTLNSFAQLYYNMNNTDGLGHNLTIPEFAKRLWGECFLDPITKTFHKSARSCPSYGQYTTRKRNVNDDEEIDNVDDMEESIPITLERTFITFILEPLYKIYSACLGENENNLNQLLSSVSVHLTKDQLRSSARPLLRVALSRFFSMNNNIESNNGSKNSKNSSGNSSVSSFIDMIIQHIPHPLAASKGKITRCYTGPMTMKDTNDGPKYTKHIQSMIDCNSNGPLIIHCVKNYSTPDGKSFLTFGRIYSGTIRPQQTVKVLGEGYTPDDDEDYSTAVVESVSIPRGRGYMKVSLAKAGNWVLLEGIDTNISKTATIVSPELLDHKKSNNRFSKYDDDDDDDDPIHIFAPLKFSYGGNESVMKLAIEPLNPAELPKMVDGLRKIMKSYPMSKTKVEESGEHILLGTGELYMDCMMHDLRNVYSNIEIKVSDPIVSFRETCIETSTIQCHAHTANKRNRLTYIAEPLDDGLAEQLELGKVHIHTWDNKKLSRFFQKQYNWDLLSSRSVWAFGDIPNYGTNILLDDTLPSDISKSLLNTCKASIVQGFQWATREGPLCEEPIRSTKIKILNATIADKPIYRGGGQIIPTSRRVVHSSILTASPRLMEPIYQVEIQCPGTIVDSITPVITRRRGHIVSDKPISGTIFSIVKGYLPILDSFGFETDLRTFTQGQAMVYSVFDHWAIIPGDPLDRNIVLHPLEPSPIQHLARELLIKTRRRKGLSDDVAVSQYFDDDMKKQLLLFNQDSNKNMTLDMENNNNQDPKMTIKVR